MTTAPSAGSKGISHMCARKNMLLALGAMLLAQPLFLREPRAAANGLRARSVLPLPLQQINFINVYGFPVAEEGDQNAQSHSRLRGRVGGHENREYLAMQPPKSRERNQVQVHSVQDQFNRHQNDHHVPPR